MPEEVVTPEGAESQEAETEVEAPATPPEESITTLKKRLSGKDQALTTAQKRAAELQAERDELSRWKAERENADLSEVERLQKKLAEAEAREQAATAKALRIDLEKRFPLTFDLLGDKTPLDDEAWLTEREARLKGDESEPEPRVDPNNPRRNPPTAPKAETAADIEARLKSFGNPFAAN